MIARTRNALARSRGLIPLAALLTASTLSGSGCAAKHLRREADRVPVRGVIDPGQPRELEMTSQPRYAVAPPDELDITVKPLPTDWGLAMFVVQQDGMLDLGHYGDIHVTGLTLQQIEDKITERLMYDDLQRGRKVDEPYRVAVRLANSQSKFYYVMGTVASEGKYPIKGQETVLDAILQAGLKTNSLPEKAYLVRPHPAGAHDEVLRIDWIAIRDRGDTLTNYQLFPGDRVVVPGTSPPGLLQTLLGR